MTTRSISSSSGGCSSNKNKDISSSSNLSPSRTPIQRRKSHRNSSSSSSSSLSSTKFMILCFCCFIVTYYSIHIYFCTTTTTTTLLQSIRETSTVTISSLRQAENRGASPPPPPPPSHYTLDIPSHPNNDPIEVVYFQQDTLHLNDESILDSSSDSNNNQHQQQRQQQQQQRDIDDEIVNDGVSASSSLTTVKKKLKTKSTSDSMWNVLYKNLLQERDVMEQNQVRYEHRDTITTNFLYTMTQQQNSHLAQQVIQQQYHTDSKSNTMKQSKTTGNADEYDNDNDGDEEQEEHFIQYTIDDDEEYYLERNDDDADPPYDIDAPTITTTRTNDDTEGDEYNDREEDAEEGEDDEDTTNPSINVEPTTTTDPSPSTSASSSSSSKYYIDNLVPYYSNEKLVLSETDLVLNTTNESSSNQSSVSVIYATPSSSKSSNTTSSDVHSSITVSTSDDDEPTLVQPNVSNESNVHIPLSHNPTTILYNNESNDNSTSNVSDFTNDITSSSTLASILSLQQQRLQETKRTTKSKTKVVSSQAMNMEQHQTRHNLERQQRQQKRYENSARCVSKRIQYDQQGPYLPISDEKDDDDSEEWEDEIDQYTIEYANPTTNNDEEQSSQEEVLSTTTVRRTKSDVYNKPNRTLVVIMGSIRGGEPAWESLYRNVLDINNADLALLIGRHRNYYTTTNNSTYPHNSTLFQRAKYIWIYNEENESINNFWSNAIDEMVLNDPLLYTDSNAFNWRTTIMKHAIPARGLFGPLKDTYSNGTTYERPGSGAIVFIFRVWLSQKIQQHNLQNQYYRFIITRADHYYLCPHNVDTFLPPLPSSSTSTTSQTNISRSKFLWTPNGRSDFGGITDRHLVVTNRYVLDALNIFPAFFHSYLHHKLLPRRLQINPERLINYIWSSCMCFIPYYNDRFNRTMFTVGSDGDTTRWQSYSDTVNVSYLLQGSSGINSEQPITENRSVRLKYISEYNESTSNCRLH